MAIELKGPPRSLWACQILSTKGESDGLSSMVKICFCLPDTNLVEIFAEFVISELEEPVLGVFHAAIQGHVR